MIMGDLMTLDQTSCPMRTYVNLVAVSEDGQMIAHLVKDGFPAHLAGRVTFPGGKMESGDASPVHAAIREAFEEAGIAADPCKAVVLREVTTPFGPLFTCFIACDISNATTRSHERVFIKPIDAPLSVVPDSSGLIFADDYEEIMRLARPHIESLRGPS